MRNFFRFLLALLRREFALEKNIFLALLRQSLDLFLMLVVFYFLTKTLNSRDYFLFIFSGLTFALIYHFWLVVFIRQFRQEQYLKTLPELMRLPLDDSLIIFALGLSRWFYVLLEIILFFVVGYLLGSKFSLSLYSVLSFLGINIIFAFLGEMLLALAIVVGQGDSLTWLLIAVFDVLSGVYFPPEIFPKYFQKIIPFLPTTQLLLLWRKTLFGFPAEINYSVVLVWFFAGYLLSKFLLKFSFRYLRRTGRWDYY